MENKFSVALGEGARRVKHTFWLASLLVLALSTGTALLVSRQVIISMDRAEEQLKASVCEPCVIDGHGIEISVSGGLSIYPDVGTDAETLIKHADAAMYRVKREAAEAHGPAASRTAV